MARLFGVEIEYGARGNADVPLRVRTELAAAGLMAGTGRHGYAGHDNHYWVEKMDGSVPGGEVVSPPLDFDDEDQRAQVDRAVAAMVRAGAVTDPSAGIHIHVDARDLTAEQVAAVGRLFAKFEDLIYAIAASGWQTVRSGGMATYCRPLTEDQIQGFTRVKSNRQLERAYYGRVMNGSAGHGHGARYCGINIHSWFFRGTIEFRVFNSSLNSERIQAYIALCVALVQDARNGKKRSVNKAYRLGGMHAGTTNPKNAYHRLQQILRYEVGISMKDYKRINKVWKDSRPQARPVRTY